MAKSKSQLPKSWTTVTRTSKIVALLLYFVMLGVGFWAGMQYEKGQVKTQVQPICPIYYQNQSKTGILPYRTLQPYCPLRSGAQ
jgi:hypothetical protein